MDGCKGRRDHYPSSQCAIEFYHPPTFYTLRVTCLLFYWQSNLQTSWLRPLLCLLNTPRNSFFSISCNKNRNCVCMGNVLVIRVVLNRQLKTLIKERTQ